MSKFTIFLPLFIALFFTNCSTQNKEVSISIAADNSIMMNHEIVDLKNLPAELTTMNLSQNTKVSMSIDKMADMGTTQEVHEILRSAELTNVIVSK